MENKEIMSVIDIFSKTNHLKGITLVNDSTQIDALEIHLYSQNSALSRPYKKTKEVICILFSYEPHKKKESMTLNNYNISEYTGIQRGNQQE